LLTAPSRRTTIFSVNIRILRPTDVVADILQYTTRLRSAGIGIRQRYPMGGHVYVCERGWIACGPFARSRVEHDEGSQAHADNRLSWTSNFPRARFRYH
jgi:hypothetical protein